MQWEDQGRFQRAKIGHLYAYIERIEAYAEPAHPLHEPAFFAWFVAPDDEDKNERRALDIGQAPSFEAAEAAICDSIEALGQLLIAVRAERGTNQALNAFDRDTLVQLRARLLDTGGASRREARITFARHLELIERLIAEIDQHAQTEGAG